MDGFSARRIEDGVHEARNPRAMPAAELAREAPVGVETVAEPDPIRALDTAVRLAGPEGLVMAVGSLYLVGELFRIYGIDGDAGEFHTGG